MSLECSYQVREVIRLSKIAFSALIECFIFRIVSYALHKSRKGKKIALEKKCVWRVSRTDSELAHINIDGLTADVLSSNLKRLKLIIQFYGGQCNSDEAIFRAQKVITTFFSSRAWCNLHVVRARLFTLLKESSPFQGGSRSEMHKRAELSSIHLLGLMLQHDWCLHDVTLHDWTDLDASKLLERKENRY